STKFVFTVPAHYKCNLILTTVLYSFPHTLQESEGKLFCSPCNIVFEHKCKSSIDKHFATAKHQQRVSETRQQSQQIPMIESLTSRAVASMEKIKVRSVSTCRAVNIPLSKSDHPAMRRFLRQNVINGGAIPSFQQLTRKNRTSNSY
uniref:U1-type domain-containing protein n=1 Tax=Fundulus heteroclitus TaxID=8078 RepID=A0A3Q2NMV1_FUNHE